MFIDKSLPCRTCGKDFVFTAGEQEYFRLHALSNDPKRCANCRVVRRFVRSGVGIANICEVNCGDCGAMTTVPFEPKGYKPVYCNHCLLLRKNDIAPTALGAH